MISAPAVALGKTAGNLANAEVRAELHLLVTTELVI